MFALRRVAVRAVQFQPTRQLSTFRPISSSFQSQKATLYRSYHQSGRRLAEEEKKESPAEAAGGETVTAEPSPSEVKEESIATPEVADAAQDTTPAPAESAAQEATEEVKNAIESAKDSLSSVVENAKSTVDAAANTARQQFPGNRGPVQPSKIIYVGNLFFEVTAPQLEAEFGRLGEIANTRVITDHRGMSKGFGYIEFTSQDAADRAVRELDQKVFQGRRMAVQYHVRKETRGGPKRESSPGKTLFIGNLSYQMSDRDLNDLFRQIKNVLDVRVAIDRRSGQPRGFAHADFIDEPSATKAKELLEKKVVYGRQLRVDYTTSSASSSSGSTGPRE